VQLFGDSFHQRVYYFPTTHLSMLVLGYFKNTQAAIILQSKQGVIPYCCYGYFVERGQLYVLDTLMKEANFIPERHFTKGKEFH